LRVPRTGRVRRLLLPLSALALAGLGTGALALTGQAPEPPAMPPQPDRDRVLERLKALEQRHDAEQFRLLAEAEQVAHAPTGTHRNPANQPLVDEREQEAKAAWGRAAEVRAAVNDLHERGEPGPVQEGLLAREDAGRALDELADAAAREAELRALVTLRRADLADQERGDDSIVVGTLDQADAAAEEVATRRQAAIDAQVRAAQAEVAATEEQLAKARLDLEEAKEGEAALPELEAKATRPTGRPDVELELGAPAAAANARWLAGQVQPREQRVAELEEELAAAKSRVDSAGEQAEQTVAGVIDKATARGVNAAANAGAGPVPAPDDPAKPEAGHEDRVAEAKRRQAAAREQLLLERLGLLDESDEPPAPDAKGGSGGGAVDGKEITDGAESTPTPAGTGTDEREAAANASLAGAGLSMVEQPAPAPTAVPPVADPLDRVQPFGVPAQRPDDEVEVKIEGDKPPVSAPNRSPMVIGPEGPGGWTWPGFDQPIDPGIESGIDTGIDLGGLGRGSRPSLDADLKLPGLTDPDTWSDIEGGSEWDKLGPLDQLGPFDQPNLPGQRLPPACDLAC
jgi:hypothetical protein